MPNRFPDYAYAARVEVQKQVRRFRSNAAENKLDESLSKSVHPGSGSALNPQSVSKAPFLIPTNFRGHNSIPGRRDRCQGA
jgi:hypothetical protein